MVLFDEDPVSLITETTNQFHISPDKEAISRISSSLNALAFNRSSRLEAQQAATKDLSRRLNTLKSQHEYEQARRNTNQHASDILTLDGEKFRIAKVVNEIEVDGERLSGEIAMLTRSIEELQRDGTNKGSDNADEAVLKLQVYRSMGIELSTDKVAIRNERSLTVVDLRTESRHTDQVWEAMR